MNHIPPELEPGSLTESQLHAAPTILTDERAQAVIAGLKRATEAAFALLEELAQSRSDGDDWTRLPKLVRKGNQADPATRCAVSKWGRSKIISLIEKNLIRDKHVGTSRFYSLADVRVLLRARGTELKRDPHTSS